MALFLGSSRKRYNLTWQQRAGGVCLAIFLLIHAPTLSFEVEYSDDTVRLTHWSPLQIVAVGLLKTNPEWHPWARYLLLPGTLFETLTRTVDACYVNQNQLDPCDWKKLSDWKALLERADYRDKVDIFADAMGEYRQYIQAAAAAATVFSFSSSILDGTVGLIGGYASLAYLGSKAGCNVIPPTNMCVALIIAVYVIMSSGEPQPPTVRKPSGSAAVPDKKPASPVKAAPSPKKRR